MTMGRGLAVRRACWLDRPQVSETNTDSPKLPHTPRLHPSYGLCRGSGSREAPQHCALRRVAGRRTWRRHPCWKASSPSTAGALAETDEVGDPADPFPVMNHDGRVQQSRTRLLRHLLTPNRAYLSHPLLWRDRLRSGETSHTHKTVDAAARRTHPLRSCSPRWDIPMVRPLQRRQTAGGGYSAACPSCC